MAVVWREGQNQKYALQREILNLEQQRFEMEEARQKAAADHWQQMTELDIQKMELEMELMKQDAELEASQLKKRVVELELRTSEAHLELVKKAVPPKNQAAEGELSKEEAAAQQKDDSVIDRSSGDATNSQE